MDGGGGCLARSREGGLSWQGGHALLRRLRGGSAQNPPLFSNRMTFFTWQNITFARFATRAVKIYIPDDLNVEPMNRAQAQV